MSKIFSLIVLTITALILAIAVVTQSAQAQTFTVIHNFAGYPSDGALPYAGVVRDAHGNLYGSTFQGGSFNAGTVFKLDKSGTETVLDSFGVSDGAEPYYAALIRDSEGNLYGTTEQGGAYGSGTVFKVDTSGTETVLYSFCPASGCSDGESPYAGLILDAAGNLYGTTSRGGAYYSGVAFKVDTTGAETVLHNFGYGFDGVGPVAGLVFDKTGNLYGTTAGGGPYGQGVVFKLSSANGWTETMLYSFSGGDNGANPAASVTLDTKGNLYGTTVDGGAYDVGVVFRLKPSTKGAWNISALYSFTGNNDGGNPWAGVIFDRSGNLYGTTLYGGYYQGGTVFKLEPKQKGQWKESVLYDFTGGTDGAKPYAGVIRDAKGNLYGTASLGGSYGYGTVFEVTP